MDTKVTAQVHLSATQWAAAVIVLIAAIMFIAIFAEGVKAILAMLLLFAGFGGTIFAVYLLQQRALAIGTTSASSAPLLIENQSSEAISLPPPAE